MSWAFGDLSAHSYNCVAVKDRLFCFLAKSGRLFVFGHDLREGGRFFESATSIAVSGLAGSPILACSVRDSILLLAARPPESPGPEAPVDLAGDWPSLALLARPERASGTGAKDDDGGKISLSWTFLSLEDRSLFSCPPGCSCVKSAVEYLPGRVLLCWGHGTRFLEVTLRGASISLADARIQCPGTNDLNANLVCPSPGRILAFRSASRNTSVVELLPLAPRCSCRARRPAAFPIPAGFTAALVAPELILGYGWTGLSGKKAYVYLLEDGASSEVFLPRELEEKMPQVACPVLCSAAGGIFSWGPAGLVRVSVSSVIDGIADRAVRDRFRACAKGFGDESRQTRDPQLFQGGRHLKSSTSVSARLDPALRRLVIQELPALGPSLEGTDQQRPETPAMRGVGCYNGVPLGKATNCSRMTPAEARDELSRSIVLTPRVASLPGFRFPPPVVLFSASAANGLGGLPGGIPVVPGRRRSDFPLVFLLDAFKTLGGTKSIKRLTKAAGADRQGATLSLTLVRQALTCYAGRRDPAAPSWACGPAFRERKRKLLPIGVLDGILAVVTRFAGSFKPVPASLTFSAALLDKNRGVCRILEVLPWQTCSVLASLSRTFDPLFAEALLAIRSSTRAQRGAWRKIQARPGLECSPLSLIEAVRHVSH